MAVDQWMRYVWWTKKNPKGRKRGKKEREGRNKRDDDLKQRNRLCASQAPPPLLHHTFHPSSRASFDSFFTKSRLRLPTMSSHETLYESSDHSPTEHDPNSLQYDFCPQVQSLGLPMYEELRKVASRCEGGEEELIDLTNCLLALLGRLDNEIRWNEKLENSIATSKGEIEQLMMQIGRLKEEREEVEAKASDLEADFEEERKKMMTKITLLERKSTEFDQIIADLSNTITQNENEFKSRISEVNIRYQQLQETHRD